MPPARQMPRSTHSLPGRIRTSAALPRDWPGQPRQVVQPFAVDYPRLCAGEWPALAVLVWRSRGVAGLQQPELRHSTHRTLGRPLKESNVDSPMRVAILTLALAALGCDLLPDPQFAQIGDSLKLEIGKVERSQSGTSAEFLFTVTNRGVEAVNACLGPSRSVWYETSGPGGVSSTLVHHSGCMKEFTIEPGRDMTWSEVLDVPYLSEARVDVEIGVEVVNPRRCGGVGCMSTRLRSNKVRVQ
jgi:hypothetical protein